MTNRNQGFTLIELMIAVAVLAIVAAIALPSYNAQVMKARRGEAKATLMSTSQALERCFTRFSTYNNAGCQTATALGGAGVTSENGHYVVTGAVAAGTFALTATPQGIQATKDTECAAYTLDQTGSRAVGGTYKGTGKALSVCWGN